MIQFRYTFPPPPHEYSQAYLFITSCVRVTSMQKERKYEEGNNLMLEGGEEGGGYVNDTS